MDPKISEPDTCPQPEAIGGNSQVAELLLREKIINDTQPSDALLLEAMNSLHANHGYSLIKHWNLPEKYCSIVRDHHNEEFDPKDMLQNLVKLADKACLKLGIGMVKEPALVLVATAEAELLHVSEVDLAQLEIMLEDSQVMANG